MTAIRVEDGRRPGVRLLTFDRPQARNAFDTTMYTELTAALRAALADDTVRVVVLTGAGSAFSAGQDLAELAALAEQHGSGRAAPNGFPQLLELLASFGKPLVAAVNGAAVGFGCTLLPHCDVVLVGHSARLRVPFAEFGVPPEAASSYLLPQRMGWQRAAVMLLTGDWVTATQAVEWGLALACHPDEQLLDAALDLAGRIARAGTAALATVKRAMLAWQAPQVTTALAAENAAYAETLGAATADAIRLAGSR